MKTPGNVPTSPPLPPPGRRQLIIREVPALQHRPEEYANVHEGYRALQLVDEKGVMRGELVW